MNKLNFLFKPALLACFVSIVMTGSSPAATDPPKAPGTLVDLGGHRLHVNCAGKGSPTAVVETGLGDFSFDWILVQARVASFTRICTYDRAGYAWSDPGPKPRTLAQINLELHDALAKLGEHGPFVLIGHSYGGPVVRNFAAVYPQNVAGIVLVDAAFEGMRVGIGGSKTMRLGEDASGKQIPPAHEDLKASDKPAKPQGQPQENTLDPMYKVLPEADQKLQLWTQVLPELEDAENSQREWSGEYFGKWMKTPQAGSLGKIPLIVLTRAEGGYGNDADVPAAQMEMERKDGQHMLVQLSSNSKQVIVQSGHNMEVEAPDEVVAAIRQVVEATRNHGQFR